MYSHLIFLALLTTLASSLSGLVSFWAATSRRSWMVRAGVVAVLLACVVAIPAYEPFLFFLIQCVVVVAGVHIHLIWRRQADWYMLARQARFSLRSLLFAATLTAGLLAVLVRFPQHPLIVWAILMFAGFACGCVTLLGAWAFLPEEGRRWQNMVVAIAAALLMALPLVVWDGFLLDFPELWRTGGPVGAVLWVFVLPGLFFVIGAWLAAWRSATSLSPSQSEPSTRARRLGWIGLSILTAAAVTPCLYVYIMLYERASTPAPDMASPNGYDAIVAVTRFYVPNFILQNATNATDGELATALIRNQNVFAQLRVALAQPCEQRLEYKYGALPLALGNQNFRPLARALLAEAEFAQRHGKSDQAANSCQDVLRFGHSMDRGGLLVDWLVGRAIEGMATHFLYGLRGELSPRKRLELIGLLRNLELGRENLGSIVERDRNWGLAAYGWRGRLYELIDPGDTIADACEESLLRSQAIARLLVVDFAARNYHAAHGCFPTNLDQLKLDRRMLKDPFLSDRACLAYRLIDGDFEVYSVGLDGDDDGGKSPSDGIHGDGDLRLDRFFES